MARDHAQLLHRIWTDREFLTRPSGSQRVFAMLISQPSMNYAGVLDLTVGRWARYAPDTDVQGIRAALADLGAEPHRFVVVDEDTEEVLVRSFIRNDGLWRNVRMLRVAIREGLTTQSPLLRRTLAAELARLPRVVVPDEKLRDGKPAAEARACQQELDEAVAALGSAPALAPAAAPGSGGGAGAVNEVAAAPEPAPSAGAPRARAFGDGDGDVVGDGSVVAFGARELNLEGDVPEVDAGAREQDDVEPPAVPDTAPAPLEELDPEADERAYAEFVAAAQQRTTAPPPLVSPIEGAMPPARCRNHLELESPPPCGRCADARRAQEEWTADRNAKITKARADAQAEIAAAKAVERAAIDRCDRCDDRGITRSGVRCTHDTEADRSSPGRAEWRNARRQLEERSTRRKGTEPASGEQLQRLAIGFGAHGNTDRDARIDWCNANLPEDREPITSTTQLTVAEASKLIDLLEAEPPADIADDVVDAPIVEDEPAGDEPPPAYSAEALYDDADAMEAAVLAARQQTDPGDDGIEPEPEGDDAFEAEYRTDQQTWTTDEPPYAYVSGADEPPF